MNFILIVCIFSIFGVSSVASFSWKNCGGPSDPIKVLSLDVQENTMNLLDVSGRAKVATNITTPVQGKVLMRKKFFWGWSAIPCVDQIGSCTYDDVCALSPYLNTTCPTDFIANGLPCKCPILEGQYIAKKLPVDLKILPHWLDSGRYKIQFTLTENYSRLLCLAVDITI